MAAISAFMLSLLVVRRVASPEQFNQRFAGAWLVWEPGVWQPTRGNPRETPTLVTTGAGPDARPAAGDALCFRLPEDRPLRLGRTEGAEIVINDATVSREQLVLETDGKGGWTVKVFDRTAPVTLRGATLAVGVAHPMNGGDRLRVGDVDLSFYDFPGFLARLDQKATEARK